MQLAVAGNPNSGKTTLFNALTGATARVGNYPGVTVERKEATVHLPDGTQARCIDLPGCYSLTARSPEEEVAHRVLVGTLGGRAPDVVVCVVDATQLARGLYLVLQLLEMNLPVVVALNMMDVAARNQVRIDAERLGERLGCAVVPISARLGTGLTTLRMALTRAAAAAQKPTPVMLAPDDESAEQTSRNDDERESTTVALNAEDEDAVQRVCGALAAAGHNASRGAGLWLLTSALEEIALPLPEPLRAAVDKERIAVATSAGDFNRRVIAARYAAVDRVLTDVLDVSQARMDTRTEQLDRVLLHPFWGFVVFLSAMFVLFQAVFAWAEPLMDGVEDTMAALATWASDLLPVGHTQSLVVNGVIVGVGNVLTFLPQIALLFFGLTLLEESGYMARAAFLLDRLMARVGLHGKAFIPLMSSFACAVPGIMAARTVESSRDRLVTILVAPFMSCSARLPVYTLVIAATFSAMPPLFGVISVGGLVIFSMYLLGFVAAIGTAALLKGSIMRAPVPPLLLELPIYRAPSVSVVARRVFERCKVFVRQTGAVILALSILLWGILTFPQQNMPASEQAAARAHIAARHLAPADEAAALAHQAREERAYTLEHTLGGRLGRAIEPAIKPLGFDWRIGVGLVASFAAREVLVSTLGQVYALDADVKPDSPALRDALRTDVDPATGKERFTPVVGVSLMVFFVLAMQCLSTVATVRRETNSWRWPLLQLVYMNTLAYVASLVVYQVGHAMGWG